MKSSSMVSSLARHHKSSLFLTASAPIIARAQYQRAPLVPFYFPQRPFHCHRALSQELKPTGASTPALSTAKPSVPLDPSVSAPLDSTNAKPESRLRRLVRQYGAVAVGSYLVIYVSTLGMVYVAIKERWVGGVDVQHWIDAFGLSEKFEHVDPRSGDFAVAWIATKFTEPIRLAVTAAITPAVARMIGMAPPKAGKEASNGVDDSANDSTDGPKLSVPSPSATSASTSSKPSTPASS